MATQKRTLLLYYHCAIRREHKDTMVVLLFRLIYLPPALYILGIFYRPIHSLIYLFMYWRILASRSLYSFGASSEASNLIFLTYLEPCRAW